MIFRSLNRLEVSEELRQRVAQEEEVRAEMLWRSLFYRIEGLESDQPIIHDSHFWEFRVFKTWVSH